MTSLRTFLMGLAIDPAKLAAFIRDPKAAMDAAGLDGNDRRALESGSAGAMWGQLLGRPTEIPAPPAAQNDRPGSLVVVGTGIRTVGHLTMEAVAWIQESDVV